MTATNHVLAGSLFAASTADILPIWVILPTSFMLHFVLDALPHFGQPDDQTAALGRLKWLLPVDATLAFSVLVLITVIQPESWQLITAAGMLCASPDLTSIPRFWRFLKNGDTSFSSNWFVQFHSRIQREFLWGIYIELVFLVILSVATLQILN